MDFCLNRVCTDQQVHNAHCSSLRKPLHADSAVHIGVTRSRIKEVELNIDARRTKYGLLGTGFHGTNGIDSITAFQIYKSMAKQ
jgi:hypothetical protein